MEKNNNKQFNIIILGLDLIGFTLGTCLDCVELIFVTIGVTAVVRILQIVISRPKTIGEVILGLISFIIDWMCMFGFYFICKWEVMKAILCFMFSALFTYVKKHEGDK
jgi:hypothetical protein